MNRNFAIKFKILILIIVCSFLFGSCSSHVADTLPSMDSLPNVDSQHSMDSQPQYPTVKTIANGAALHTEPSVSPVVVRVTKNTILQITDYVVREDEVWYLAKFQNYTGYILQDLIEHVSEGNVPFKLPEYDRWYVYAGNPASVEEMEEFQEYIDMFTGIWFCDKRNSVNDENIEMTITCSEGRLMILRDMGNDSVSQYAVAIPRSNSVDASYMKSTITIEDGILYEIFNDGRKNKYIPSDGSDYVDTIINEPQPGAVFSPSPKRINTKRALTKEEADALIGTGYKGTRPNSFAEHNKLQAAMVKCKECGMHSDNGANSLCDECEYNKKHGYE